MGERRGGPVKSRSKPESDWRTAVSTFCLGSWNCLLLLLMSRLHSVPPSGGVIVGRHGFQSSPLPISISEAVNNRPLASQHRMDGVYPFID